MPLRKGGIFILSEISAGKEKRRAGAVRQPGVHGDIAKQEREQFIRDLSP